MKPVFIAHRGNVDGKDPSNENKLEYIRHALNLGHFVEIDINYRDGKLYLGHDDIQEECPRWIINDPGVYTHAKDVDALKMVLSTIPDANVFWHESDTVTFTKFGHLWCHPGHYVDSKRAIWLDLPELSDTPLPPLGEIYGVCGDDIKRIQK
jgi:glycerophosphoryl diester phosphodiesterase